MAELPELRGELDKLEELNLDGNNFFKGLCPMVGQFRELKKVISVDCKTTRIPDDLWDLELLEVVTLSANDFSEGISDIIDRTPELKIHQLRSCSVTSLPVISFGYLQWLEVLTLSANDFSEGISDMIDRTPELKIHQLRSCNVTSLPVISFGYLQWLEELCLPWSNFSNGLLRSVERLERLRKLELKAYKMPNLLDWFGNCKQTIELDISKNNFSCGVSPAIGQLPQLTSLRLDDWQIETIPDSFEELFLLEHLVLSRNRFSKRFPSSIKPLRRLKGLTLSICELRTFADLIEDLMQICCRFDRLVQFDLGPSSTVIKRWETDVLAILTNHRKSSSFASKVKFNSTSSAATSSAAASNTVKRHIAPHGLMAIFRKSDAELEELCLPWSNFSNGLLRSVERLERLRKLELKAYKMPNLLDWFGNCKQTIELDISKNNFSCGVSPAIGQLPQLTSLCLDDLQIETIPDSFEELFLLDELCLSGSNFLNGLPLSVVRLQRLRKLELEDCKMFNLPDCFGNLKQFDEQPLSGVGFVNFKKKLRRITGSQGYDRRECKMTTIPESLGHLDMLEHLVLSRNRFSNGLPSSIKPLRRLKNLTISDCILIAVPDCIGNRKQLNELDQSKNNFFCGVSPAIGQLRQRTSLCLDECQIETIPDSFGELPLQRGNCIKQLPTELPYTSLEKLELDETPTTGLPEAIWTQGINAIKSFMRVLILGHALMHADTFNMIGDIGADSRSAHEYHGLKTSLAKLAIDKFSDVPAEASRVRRMSCKPVVPQDNDMPSEVSIDKCTNLKLVVPHGSQDEPSSPKQLSRLPATSLRDATAEAAYQDCKTDKPKNTEANINREKPIQHDKSVFTLQTTSVSPHQCVMRLVDGYWSRTNNQLCNAVVATGLFDSSSTSVQQFLGGRLPWLAQLATGHCQNVFSLELLRLASFADWPHLGKLSALRCSSAGFHRKTAVGTTTSGDDVACFSCGCTVEKWIAGIHPMVLHRDKCAQHCGFVTAPRNSGNISIGKDPIQMPTSEGAGEVLAAPPSVASATASSAEIPSAADCMSSLGVNPLKPLVALALGSYSEAGLAAIASGSSLVKDLIATSRRTGVQSAAGSASASRDDELTKHESYRLGTFSNVWTYDHIVDARELARNGFFYAGPGDRVQCAFCQGLLRNWEPGDRVDEQHAQHFTYCRFVQGHEVGNVPIPFWSLAAKQTAHVNAMDTADASRADLGITSTPPKNPEFAIEARRLSTFATWPTTHHLQPDVLAKAGFFYLGKEDAARCFFCDGTVADWKTNGDPWIEHAQRFPSCSFVLQVKGHDFVQRHRLQDPPPASSSRPSLAVDPREVRARMDANKVRILLQMDYPLDLIREVVQKRLATVGSDHDTSEQLLDDVFQTHDEKQKANSTQSAGRRAAPDSAGPVVISRMQFRGTDEPAVQSLPIGGARSPMVAMAASAPAALKADGSLTVHNLSRGAEKLPPLVSLPAVAQPPEEENRQLKTQLTCKVCMDSLVGIVFLPCGHLVCCASCAPAMTTCPICRVSIRGTVRTIL